MQEERPTIKTHFGWQPNLFHPVFGVDNGTCFVITNRDVPANTPVAVAGKTAEQKISNLFVVYDLEVAGNFVGHLLSCPQGRAECLGSSVLARTAALDSIMGSACSRVAADTRIVLRTSLFFVYHIPNFASLAANPKVRSGIHEALTSL